MNSSVCQHKHTEMQALHCKFHGKFWSLSQSPLYHFLSRFSFSILRLYQMIVGSVTFKIQIGSNFSSKVHYFLIKISALQYYTSCSKMKVDRFSLVTFWQPRQLILSAQWKMKLSRRVLLPDHSQQQRCCDKESGDKPIRLWHWLSLVGKKSICLCRAVIEVAKNEPERRLAIYPTVIYRRLNSTRTISQCWLELKFLCCLIALIDRLFN